MNKRHESQHVAHDGSDMWRVSVGADAIKQKEIMHMKLSRDLWVPGDWMRVWKGGGAA